MVGLKESVGFAYSGVCTYLVKSSSTGFAYSDVRCDYLVKAGSPGSVYAQKLRQV